VFLGVGGGGGGGGRPPPRGWFVLGRDVATNLDPTPWALTDNYTANDNHFQ
jgi:hypothetical protein